MHRIEHLVTYINDKCDVTNKKAEIKSKCKTESQTKTLDGMEWSEY